LPSMRFNRRRRSSLVAMLAIVHELGVTASKRALEIGFKCDILHNKAGCDEYTLNSALVSPVSAIGGRRFSLHVIRLQVGIGRVMT
jgi:hypothetical protein